MISVKKLTDAELQSEWLELERLIGDPIDCMPDKMNAMYERQHEVECEQEYRDQDTREQTNG